MKFELINKDSKFDVVILAAGDFPTNEIPFTIMAEARVLVVCDSAMVGLEEYNKAHGTSIMPDAIVGDGDSLPDELKKRYASIYHHVTEQDYNDLTKSTRYAIEHYNPQTIAYVGATGKREDHTIGNISLMSFYHHQYGFQPTMITDYGWFTACSGENDFDTFSRQQVSIFNVNCKTINGRGFRWSPYTYAELWQGTLNEPTADTFSLNGDGEYMVFQTFDAKV